MTKKVTAVLLLVTIGVLGAWDLVVATNDVKGDTISEIVFDLAEGNPILPFAVGIICGHLFWGRRVEK